MADIDDDFEIESPRLDNKRIKTESMTTTIITQPVVVRKPITNDIEQHQQQRKSPVVSNSNTNISTTLQQSNNQQQQQPNPVPPKFTLEMVKWLLNEATATTTTTTDSDQNNKVQISLQGAKAVSVLLEQFVRETLFRAQHEAELENEQQQIGAKHIMKVVSKILQDFS
jgi:hypothetical protein